MNSVIKQLKLYRIATILSIFPLYWKSSKEIVEHYKDKDNKNVSRCKVYVDMLICLLRYGASDENYLSFEFYGKNHKYRDSFITWRRNIKIMRRTPKSIVDLFLDKVMFNTKFSKYIKRDWLDCKNSDVKQVMDFIDKHEHVIIKPKDSACGVGIRKVSKNDLSIENIEKLAGQNYIIEEIIYNCDGIARLNPSSLNTLRMVTATGNEGNVAGLSGGLRMGVGKNITDNAHTGGIACCVNSQTGYLSKYGRTFKDEIFNSHPTSHIIFEECKIPIDGCITFVHNLAREVPKARLVGWDIALTRNGLEVLEANIPPGEDLTELDLKGKWHILCELLN